MKEFITEHKQKIIVCGCILAAIVIVFILLLATVKPRVIGVWQKDVGYMDYYGCAVISTLVLDDDGSFSQIYTNANTGAVLKTKSGVWTVSWFEVQCREIGERGYSPYMFNPIANQLNNNGVYKKIS